MIKHAEMLVGISGDDTKRRSETKNRTSRGRLEHINVCRDVN